MNAFHESLLQDLHDFLARYQIHEGRVTPRETARAREYFETLLFDPAVENNRGVHRLLASVAPIIWDGMNDPRD